MKKYWSMKAKGPKAAEVLIYEQIGGGFWSEGIGAKQFAKDLKELGDIDQLDIRINSEGGSVFEGQAIYSQLKNHKATKTVYIDGLAASIASVIAMAGDTIIMPENATMMVHDPWTIAMGNAEDMRKSADALDTIKLGIIAAYRNKTGLDDAEISQIMTDETWMSAKDALEKGFCDECEKPMEMAASVNKAEVIGRILAMAKPVASAPPAAPAAPNAAPIKPKEVIKMKCKKHPTVDMVVDACPVCDQEQQTQASVKQARENELLRVKALRAVGKEFKFVELAEHAVENDWTEDQLRQEILNRIKKSSAPGEPLNIKVTPNHEGKPFRSFGEQLIAVVASARGQVDQRLKEVYNAPLGGSETVPSDGGFLVQSDFTTQLLELTHETSILMPKCREIPVSGNGIDAPVVDETSRATGSRFGGVQVYRTNEAAGITAKKPKLGSWAMKLEKIMGIFYATDELIEDAAALENIASNAFAEEFGFVIDDEIVRGSGAGQMLGILESGALVSVAAETGQLTKTIVPENLDNMFARMPARQLPGAEWYINMEIWPQLFGMVRGAGAAAVPVFMPPSGIAGAPYGTIHGRPIVPIEQASALGTIGDIIFANMKQYGVITKGGLKAAQSIHVQFLTDQTAFRWTTRNNGQPIPKSSITPYKAASTFKVSPFVALASR